MSSRNTSVQALVAFIMILGLWGCGKEDSASSSGDGATKTAAAPTAPVEDKSALVGMWFAPEGDNVMGLEFTKDGTVLLTEAGGDVLSGKYSVLDGGRLSIAGGVMDETVIFKAKVDGDALSLEAENAMRGFGNKAGPQVFNRLPQGQTVAMALDANRKRRTEQMVASQAKSKDKRTADLKTVAAMLATPKLGFASSDPADTASKMAFDLKQSTKPDTFEGTVWMADEKNPTQWAATAVIEGFDKVYAGPVAVNVTFNKLLGPPGENAAQPQPLRLETKEDGSDATLHMGKWQLKTDETTYAAAVAQYDAKLKSIKDKTDALLKPFGDVAFLEGDLFVPNANQAPLHGGIALRRMKDGISVAIADTSGNPYPQDSDFNKIATIQIQEDGNWLTIDNNSYFKIGDEGGVPTLQGPLQQWNGRQAMVKLVKAFTNDELAAEQAAVSKALAEVIKPGLVIAGVSIDDQEKTWVALSIVFGGDAKSLTAKARRCDVAATTTADLPVTVIDGLLGRRLIIQDKAAAAARQRPTCILDMAIKDGKVTLDGEVNGLKTRGAPKLSIISDEKALLADAVMVLQKHPDWGIVATNGRERFTFKVDDAGKVSADYFEVANKRLVGPVPATVTMTNDGGVVRLVIENPAGSNKGLNIGLYRHTLWMSHGENEDEPYLPGGRTDLDGRNPWAMLYAPLVEAK